MKKNNMLRIIVYKKFSLPYSGHTDNSSTLQPPNFWQKIRIESLMLDCTHILEIVPSPTQGTQTTVQLNYPPNVWHGNHKCWIVYTLYTRNFSLSYSGHTDNSSTLWPSICWQKISIESLMLDSGWHNLWDFRAA